MVGNGMESKVGRKVTVLKRVNKIVLLLDTFRDMYRGFSEAKKTGHGEITCYLPGTSRDCTFDSQLLEALGNRPGQKRSDEGRNWE